MQEPSIYNQVIFKNADDKNNADLVNSYRFKSASPHKFKRWSPELSREERYKKKREREDNYVKTLEPEEKPILLIKKKNLYKNLKSPHIVEHPSAKNDYYKVSKNTEVVEDIPEQIQLNEDLIRRETNVYNYKNDPAEPATLKNIYKIDGLEFLPEGFLELEPLLMKDEYNFDSKVHEKMFDKEQEKYKAMRRKQYGQKDYQKRREVTIFVVDQYKDKLIDYLDQWYAANKRKMTPDELEYISKVLKSDPQTLAKLQDLYLHRKKVVNSQKLHSHLYPEGQLKDERYDNLPENLKSLFVTRPKEAYDDVSPRVYQTNGPYDPTYLRKHKQPYQRNRSHKPASSKNAKSLQNSGKLNSKDQEFLKFTDNFENILNGGTYNPYQNTQPLSDNNFANTTGRIKKNVKYDNDLKAYFDTEINTILDRIKGFQAREKPEVPAVANKESQKYIDMYKEKLGDIMRDPSSSEIIRMDSQLKKYNENPEAYKPYARTEFVNNPTDFNWRAKNSSISSNYKAKISMTSDIREELPQKDSIVSQVPERKATANKSFVSHDEKNFDETTRLNDTFEAKRVTVVSRNDHGASIVSQKLRPSLVANEYYFQVIDDIIESKGLRKVTILTRNEKGEIIAEQTLDIQDIGNFYNNYVIMQPQENKISILVRNEKGETICVTPVSPGQPDGDELIEAVLQRNGTRRSTIATKRVDGEIRRSHKIRPTLVGSEYYNQLIEEVIEGTSKKKLTVTTFNENGDVVSISKANPNLMAENYYTEIIADILDENGQRKITMVTKNNKGDTVIQQTFTTSLAGILADQHYTEMLEEIEDEFGKRKVTIASKNARGYTEVHQQVRPTFLGENYYIEIVDDAIDKAGNRKITLAAKDNAGATIIEKQFEPDASETIGEKYYSDMTRELEKELQALNQIRNVSHVRPETPNLVLEMIEDVNPQGEHRVTVIARNTNGVVLLEKSYSIDEAAVLGDEHYDAIINDIEDELANRKKDSIIRRNTAASRQHSPTKTSKLSQINEEEEKRSVSASSISRPSKTGERLAKTIVTDALGDHEKHILNKNAVSVFIPRVTKVRDSYYRDLLNELGLNKKNLNKNQRFTQQYNAQVTESSRNKAYTINPNYTESKKISIVRTKKVSTTVEQKELKESFEARDPNVTRHKSGLKGLTESEIEELKPKDAYEMRDPNVTRHKSGLKPLRESELEVLRPKNLTVKAPKSSVVSVGEERNKTVSDANKKVPSNRKMAPKDSILSNNTYDSASRKNTTNSIVINQLNKKSLLEKLLHEGERPSAVNRGSTDTNFARDLAQKHYDGIVDHTVPRGTSPTLIKNLAQEHYNEVVDNSIPRGTSPTLVNDMAKKHYSEIVKENMPRGTSENLVQDLSQKHYEEIVDEKMHEASDDGRPSVASKRSQARESKSRDSKQHVVEDEEPQQRQSSVRQSSLRGSKQSIKERGQTVYHEPDNDEPDHRQSEVRKSTSFRASKQSIKDEEEPERKQSSVRKSTDLRASKQSIKEQEEPEHRESQVRKSIPTRDSKQSIKERDEPEHRESQVRQSTSRDSQVRKSTARDSKAHNPEHRETVYHEPDNHDETFENVVPAKKSSMKQPAQRLSNADAEGQIKKEIEQVFDKYRDSVSSEVLKKLEKEVRHSKEDNVLDEFYKFCENELPHDSKFKESMMMVSLFYYFMEKKKHNN